MNPTSFALYFVNSLSSYLDISLPPTIILPVVGLSNPPNRFKKVDLPAPDGPNTTTNSPLLIIKFISFNT